MKTFQRAFFAAVLIGMTCGLPEPVEAGLGDVINDLVMGISAVEPKRGAP